MEFYPAICQVLKTMGIGLIFVILLGIILYFSNYGKGK